MTGPHANTVVDIGEPPCTSEGIRCPLFDECMKSGNECTAYRAWVRNETVHDNDIGMALAPRRRHGNAR